MAAGIQDRLIKLAPYNPGLNLTMKQLKLLVMIIISINIFIMHQLKQILIGFLM